MNTGVVLFSNNGSSRLFAGIDAASTSIRVEAGTGDRFPQPVGDGSNWFMVTLEDRRNNTVEIMKCTKVLNDILTVERAQEGTTAKSFATGATVSNRLTAGTMETFFIFNGYSQTESDARYINAIGDAMEGPLELFADPAGDMQAATKKYVDDVSIDEAPTDGRAYGRQMVGWVPIGVGMPEAPTDGAVYVRGSLQWQEGILKTDFDAEASAHDADMAAVNGRIDAVEAINTTQDNRMTAIEGVNSTQDSRLDANDTQNTAQNNRLTAIESKNSDQDTRLNAVENANTNQDTRMAAIETVNTNQNTAITSLNTNLNAEVTARTNADTALQDQIDLRLTDAPNDGTTYGRRNGGWVAAGGGGSAIGEWQANNNTAPPPANGQFRLNAAPAAATHLYLSDTTAPGVDVSNLLTQFIQIGTKLYIQDKDDASRWMTCQILSTNDAGSYHDFGILYLNGAGTWVAQRAIIMIMASAAAGVTISDTPPANPKNADLWWESDTGRMFIYYGDADSSQWVQAAAAAYIQDNSYAKKTAIAKNYVINPVMNISQENGITPGGTNGYYAADQWTLMKAGGASLNFSRTNNNPAPSGSPFRLRALCTAPYATVAAGDSVSIAQHFEGYQVNAFGWGCIGANPAVKDAMLRFGVNAPAGTYHASILGQQGKNYAYIMPFTITAAQAGTDVVIEMPITGKGNDFLDDATISFTLAIVLQAGTDNIGTLANAWTSLKLATAAQSNFFATPGSIFELFDVGLYIDPDKTKLCPPFEVPEYTDDLTRCMRYYEVGYYITTGYQAGGSGYGHQQPYIVPKRTSPTLSVSGTGNVNTTSPGLVVSAQGVRQSGTATVAGVVQFLCTFTLNSRM